MSVAFDILNISIEELNDSDKLILINFFFEYKEKNLTWTFEKPYEILFSYFNILSSKLPNISPLPSSSKFNIQESNGIELLKQTLIEYLSELIKRKEIVKFCSFQRLFEFPDIITEKLITIDTLSNIDENNIIDFYFYEPFLFISCGNSNYSRALSFLFSYFEPKGSLITYKLNKSEGNYGEKKLIEIYKDDKDKIISKIKKINHFLFCGYGDGELDIFNFNKEKTDYYLYSKIKNENNSKISNIFYNKEKGFVYLFYEKDKKVSIYEININNHVKDIELTDNAIIFSYINFKMNRIFVIDSYGTFWMFELISENNSIKLLQASYNKLYDDKIYLYQYSNINNNFNLKLTCDIKFGINSIIYLKLHKCLIIGCNNGTIQIWKDTSKMPEYIIDSGYDKINKIFFDEKNKYLFICDDRNIKIMEINLENILLEESKKEDEDKINIINISETLKDEGDKAAENNIALIGKAFQMTPLGSEKKNKINDDKIENIKEENKMEINNNKEDINFDKETEFQSSNSEENEYKYEIKSINSLDGWDEW